MGETEELWFDGDDTALETGEWFHDMFQMWKMDPHPFQIIDVNSCTIYLDFERFRELTDFITRWLRH
jgi:hypothetical protein